MSITPRAELDQRREKLQKAMMKASMDAALIVQNADMFYFTGTVQQGFFYIPVEGDGYFFVRKNAERTREETPLPQIIPVKAQKDIVDKLSQAGLAIPRTMGMELDVLPVNQYRRYQKAFPETEIVDVWPLIQEIRAVKSDLELDIIRRVAHLSDYMVEVARSQLKEGMTEVELAALVEAAARARGHQGLVRMRAFNQEVYWGHLVSGPEAAELSFMDSPTGGRGVARALPQGSGYRRIGRNDPVVFDLVAGMNGYVVDQTRTLSLGPLNEPLHKAYQAAIKIQEEMGSMMKPGIMARELYHRAVQIASDFELDQHFMGYGANQAGFCGHGIGLELDELPVITPNFAMELVPGMVIALEPKFNFPGIGVVGVEDTFIVTRDGNEKITHSHYHLDVTSSSGA